MPTKDEVIKSALSQKTSITVTSLKPAISSQKGIIESVKNKEWEYVWKSY
jgi:hypothetical protein